MGKDIDFDYIRREFPEVDLSNTDALDAVLKPYFARVRAERAAIAMEARQRRDAEERPDPKDDSAGRLRHRPNTPSLQTPQGGDS